MNKEDREEARSISEKLLKNGTIFNLPNLMFKALGEIGRLDEQVLELAGSNVGSSIEIERLKGVNGDLHKAVQAAGCTLSIHEGGRYEVNIIDLPHKPDPHILHTHDPKSPHVKLCPVCKGKGKLKIEAVTSNSDTITFKSTFKNDCHGCDGKGWVTV